MGKKGKPTNEQTKAPTLHDQTQNFCSIAGLVRPISIRRVLISFVWFKHHLVGHNFYLFVHVGQPCCCCWCELPDGCRFLLGQRHGPDGGSTTSWKPSTTRRSPRPHCIRETTAQLWLHCEGFPVISLGYGTHLPWLIELCVYNVCVCVIKACVPKRHSFA